MSVLDRRTVPVCISVAIVSRRMKDERGQGSVEYVGIVLVVAAILAAVIFVIGTNDYLGIGDAIANAVRRAIESLTGRNG